ncbi:GH25 family lysozyme [Alicyclobacillus sp. SO9]|uniref:GH25 family lysozyme n=1 Tax=Alicyclobacillus sp. SO9 TaxID=2665646 RepID=UPI0018E6FD60|nr:GH25 family lysozyme [Alicyclobacillus sp. SO9]QQE80946.1 peptidoglycan-binding protein [Alicyclobacillus sp. SO9]
MQPIKKDDAKGIDVSQWQGAINWHDVAADGIVFSYIRATEGVGFTDPKFGQNMANAKAAGILEGAYHYATPDVSNDAVAEAKYFCDVVEKNGGFGELRPALDLETESGMTPKQLQQWVNDFGKYVKSRTNRVGLLYISPNFDKSKLANLAVDEELWSADWGVKSPSGYSNFNKWEFWQHSDKGSVKGISGRVDLDVFNGDLAALRTYCGLPPEPPAPVQPAPHKAPSAAPPVHHVTHVQPTKDKYPELRLERPYMHSDAVKTVQKVVNAWPIDGVYGPKTTKAVEDFQDHQHITKDGIVGPQTWGRIHYVQHHMKEIMIGAVGGEVLHLQRVLTFYDCSPGPKDEIFGIHTRGAVIKYQHSRHLQVDGIVGPQTWGSLLS